MSRSISVILIACCSCTAMIAGCHSKPSAMRYDGVAPSSSSLVFPNDSTLRDDAAVGTFAEPQLLALDGRNDHRMGSFGEDRVAAIEVLEVRQRGYLRTINGRPREFSTFYFSTVKRGVVR